MNSFKKTILAVGLALCLSAPAFASDKVVMKDGREFVGTITQETEYVVRIEVTFGELVKEHVLFTGDIASIEKDAAGDEIDAGADEAAVKAAPSAGARTAIARNQPGVLVLPLTGTVGMTFRHEEIEKVAEEARRIREETGEAPIIVLEIESGGGLVMEMEKIHDTMTQVKKEFRVVAWIKEAISAAAATAYHCDEIYFHTDGTLGAMTMFAGGKAVTGETLEQWFRDATAWAEQGGRSGMIARAMIANKFELSYDVDSATGEVTWHDDLSGEFILSTNERNLVFNAKQAEHSKFADGIADTEEELAELLDLPKWHEVSQFGREAHEKWVKTHDLALVDIPRIYFRLQITQNSTAAEPKEKLGRCIKLLQQLVRWWERAPFVCEFEVGVPPKDQLERTIRQYRKSLADIKAAEKRSRNRGRGGGG